MKKKILITGGSGFIGSRVKEDLKNSGFEILTIGRSENEDLKLDLKDTKLQNIINDFLPDIVCHFASGSNITRADENKEKEFNDTVLCSESLIKSLLTLKVKPEKIIYLSTQSVYGLPKYLPVDELHPTLPVTVYGECKLKVEELIKQSKLNYLIFRISSVYGPMQDPKKSGVIAKFIKRIKENKSPIVFNSMDLISDFIYIDDVTSAIVSVIKDSLETKNKIYNLGSGKPTSLKEILNILYKYFPNAPKPKLEINQLYPNTEQKGLYLDTNKIQSELKWHAKYNIEEGLKQMLEKTKSFSTL